MSRTIKLNENNKQGYHCHTGPAHCDKLSTPAQITGIFKSNNVHDVIVSDDQEVAETQIVIQLLFKRVDPLIHP